MVRSSGLPTSANPKFVTFGFDWFRGSDLEGTERFEIVRSSAGSKFVIFGLELVRGSGLVGNVRFGMIRDSPSSKFDPTPLLISLYNLEFRISFFISSLIAFFSILASNLD